MAVIGAGIVGLATARELILRYPNLSFLVLDKESKLGLSNCVKCNIVRNVFCVMFVIILLISACVVCSCPSKWT